MISVITFLFILGILIIVHEFGHFIIAKRFKVKVEKFSLGFGPQILSKKKDETQYCIAAIPLGGYVKLAGDNLEEYKGSPDEYLAKPASQRAAIVFFGPLLNYVLGFLCFWLVFFMGYPTLGTKVGGLLDGFGAKEAGIQVGDKIMAVDGQKVNLWEDLQKIIQSKKDAAAVKFSILRGNQKLALDVKIKEVESNDLLNQRRNVGRVGIIAFEEIIEVRHGLAQSLILSINKTWDVTFITYKALWRMVIGKLSVREATGPLGMFFITSKVAHQGIVAILNLIGLISINLAIINLLPLPILDGGHILLLGIEKIRGKTLSLKIEQIITRIGMTVIISLVLIVTYNDILRFFGDKIFKLLK